MKLNQQDYLDLSNGNYISPNQETGSTTANLKAFGVTTVPYSTLGNVFTLSAPITGIEKTLVLNASVAPGSTMSHTAIYTGSTAITIATDSTALVSPLYINVQPPYACVKMLGLSTSKWGVVSSYGAVQFSTAGTYSS